MAEGYSDRTSAAELLNAAHTAAFHWRALGEELNHMRATMLLANVHALLGHGRIALAFAEETRTNILARPDTPDWERAFVHAIHAHAACAAGEAGLHASSCMPSTRALETNSEAEDRAILLKTYCQVLVP